MEIDDAAILDDKTLPASALVRSATFADSTGRGLAAARRLDQGETVVSVPIETCFHDSPSASHAASREPELASLVAKGAQLTELDAVALQLLVERAKGERSPRAAHIACIPKAYDTTLFWSAEELDELRGSPWLELAQRYSDEVAADWASLLAQPGVANFVRDRAIGYDDYKWAYATFKSRAAECRVDGTPLRLLAPGFDLFNHDDSVTPGSSHRFDTERRALVACATRAHAEGEQVFISYGTASNGSLLLGGGFVLERNRFDSVEVCLTAQCNLRRLHIMMMIAPDAPEDGTTLPLFEFLQAPEREELEAAEGALPFVTRHQLTLEAPLPPGLVSYVRIDRCSDVDLDALERRAEKRGEPVWELLRSSTPPDATVEVLALGALRAVLELKLGAYPTTLEEDERALLGGAPCGEGNTNNTNPTAHRRRLAQLLRASEKRILRSSLEELDRRIRQQLRALLHGAAAQAADCQAVGSSWASLVSRRRATLEAQGARVSTTFERLRAASLGGGSTDVALRVQACSAFFLLLGGLNAHPRARATAYVPTASPFATVDDADAGAAAASKVSTVSLSPASLEAKGPALEYLELYASKMSMWGDYLLSQWASAKALGVGDSNTMQQESIGIRQQHAWSVPTEAALQSLTRCAPLLELGAGNGVWARALRARGVDILAYDTMHWSDAFGAGDSSAGGRGDDGAEMGVLMGTRVTEVLEGGVGEAKAHTERTLVLMWPDYGGVGTYGLSCLAGYSGERLALVGEWNRWTFGAYSAGLPEGGQSFSAKFQEAVESDFVLEEVIALPSWPFFLDRLAVWRRR